MLLHANYILIVVNKDYENGVKANKKMCNYFDIK